MNVVVGVVVDAMQRVLITKRARDKLHGGLWEFPGGKIEAGEHVEVALIREIKEEVDLDVLSYTFLDKINPMDDDSNVYLYLYLVTRFKGEAHCLETQTGLRWVDVDSLSKFKFPKANKRIIELVKKAFVTC